MSQASKAKASRGAAGRVSVYPRSDKNKRNVKSSKRRSESGRGQERSRNSRRVEVVGGKSVLVCGSVERSLSRSKKKKTI